MPINAQKYHVLPRVTATAILITLVGSVLLAWSQAFDRWEGLFHPAFVRGVGLYVFAEYPAYVAAYWLIGAILFRPIIRALKSILEQREEEEEFNDYHTKTAIYMAWPIAAAVAFIYAPVIHLLRYAFKDNG
ncbi:MAG: hypothetical protein ACTHPD_15490 [Rhizomicrobium sp.]